MDKIIRATAGDGFIKMAVITARDMVQRAREIHSCSPTASAALGRTLCAASLMGEMMKEEKATLTIRINGGGPIGSVVAVSDSGGNVRGYVGDPSVDLPLRSDGKLNVGAAVGRDGMLTVSRDIGLKEPYIGSTELISGEIAEDVTAYLLESEQVPSACALGVLVDTDLSIKAAGGFIVQLMPGADEALIGRLEENIFMMDQLTTILDEDGAAAIFDQVLKGFEYHIVGETPVAYRCYCSRDRVEEALRCIDSAQLAEMIDEGKDITVSCQFCDQVYRFSPAQLQELAAAKEQSPTDSPE
ncbi:MAG: Hsp33 family molecular chaperone HslO [Candidatus Limivicinus sp.]